MQVVEFFFDTNAGFLVLTRLVEKEVLARVAGFLVPTLADPFSARWHQVRVTVARVQKNGDRGDDEEGCCLGHRPRLSFFLFVDQSLCKSFVRTQRLREMLSCHSSVPMKWHSL